MLYNNRKFTVYCHVNKINEKRYIGITSQELNQRFRNGKGYKSSPHFNYAIKKYGWDSFEHQILFSDLSEVDAKEKEIEMIAIYNTTNPDFGYNITPGGEGYSGKDNPWFGRHHTEQSRRKMSEARKGIPKTEEWKKKISESNKGKTFSAETKAKMSKNHADFSGKKNPMYGRKLSDEVIEKMVKASKTKEAISKMKQNKVWYSGKDNPNSKKVICIETQKVYDTLNEAATDNGCNPSKVSAVCHGKRNHTNNLHFKFVGENNG